MSAFRRSACAVICFLLCLCVSALCVFALGDAEPFIAAVNRIDEIETYEDREKAIDAAYGLYDDAIADETGVAEAKRALDAHAEKLAKVKRAAEAYIEAVNRAVQAHKEEDYAATVAALADADANQTDAEAIADYPGFPAAKYDRELIRKELFNPEQASKAYIEAAKTIKTCTTYEDTLVWYLEMQSLAKEMISDYPGVAEAEETFREAGEYLAACEQKASTFIEGVTNAANADHYDAAELCRLLRLRGDVDLTVEGARDAKTTLDYLVREYNKLVRAANEVTDDMSSLGMTLGMTSAQGKLSSNVLELLK